MLCGIDEAGRGCVCGSMFMCGVLGEEESLQNLGIKDSKKLSESKRFSLATQLQTLAQNGTITYHIVEKTAQQIDSQGLSTCLKSALAEITQYFSATTHTFLFDGNTTFGLTLKAPKTLHTIIKGDSKHLLIGAASILAKVAKDTQMHELHTLYPHYGFDTNKGYGTKAHIQAISQHGYTPFHRRSFALTPTLGL
ncbi:ribonuclease HII [uncultured Helicobacter sp.]|uniref:ribonuclease HII n=1 Tax=uncultured Helicobacter sp. TaxID=175537 RepID=UPI00374FCA2E